MQERLQIQCMWLPKKISTLRPGCECHRCTNLPVDNIQRGDSDDESESGPGSDSDNDLETEVVTEDFFFSVVDIV